MHLLFDISYVALLTFKSHDIINTYKPAPRPPHLTAPFYSMQLINLQVRLATADTRLTVRILLVCHMTVLSIAKGTHEALGGITLTGESLSTPRKTCPSATLSTTGLRSNPDLYSERSVVM